MSRKRYDCPASFELGPFLFECAGHAHDQTHLHELSRKWRGGKIEHHSTSPGEIGDANLTFWTSVDDSGEVPGFSSLRECPPKPR
jgi:hypothetical protein